MIKLYAYDARPIAHARITGHVSYITGDIALLDMGNSCYAWIALDDLALIVCHGWLA